MNRRVWVCASLRRRVLVCASLNRRVLVCAVVTWAGLIDIIVGLARHRKVSNFGTFIIDTTRHHYYCMLS